MWFRPVAGLVLAGVVSSAVAQSAESVAITPVGAAFTDVRWAAPAVAYPQPAEPSVQFETDPANNRLLDTISSAVEVDLDARLERQLAREPVRQRPADAFVSGN